MAIDCKDLNDLDNVFDEKNMMMLYRKYIQLICCGSQDVEEAYKTGHSSSTSIIEVYGELFVQSREVIASEALAEILVEKSSLIRELGEIEIELNNTLKKGFSIGYDSYLSGIRQYQAFVFEKTIEVIYGMLRAFILVDYIPFILQNDEFKTLVDTYIQKQGVVEEVSDLYKIYEEFYMDVFRHKVNCKDFYVIIILYANMVSKECSFKQEKLIIELLGIECKAIIERYLDSDNNDECILPKQGDFIEKCMIHHKKYQFLNMDMSKLAMIKEMKIIYDSIESGEEFEAFLKRLYEMMGYTVTQTPIIGD